MTAGAVSYSSIQSILGARCARCHNAGNINWMDENIAKAAAQRGSMRMMLENHIMPLEGSPEATAFTEEERQKILSWADSVSAGPAQE